MKKRYIKIVSLVLGFGLAASMVAGCSVKSSENVVTTAVPTATEAETTASAESGGSAAEQKKMIFWDRSEYVEGYSTMMKAEVDEFASENYMDVDYVVVPAADMKQKLMAAIETSNAPDSIMGDDTLVRQFVSTQQTVECSDVFEAVDFTENSKILGTFNGKPCLVSLAFTAFGMYSRTDQWERTGMDILITWEELKEGAKLVNDPANGFYGPGFAMGAPDGGDAEGFCRTIILGWGGIPVDKNGKVTVNPPETLEVLEFIASLHEEGLIPPDVITGDDSRNNDAYPAGTVGVIANSGSAVPGMKEEKPDFLANTQIIAYPAGLIGEVFILGGADVFGILEASKNIETIKEFVKYYFEDLDNYNAMIEAMGVMWQPVVNGVDDTDFWKDPINVGWFANSKNAYEIYYPASSGERVMVLFTNQLCVKVVQEIAVNKADPQEALDHLEAGLNKIYN